MTDAERKAFVEALGQVYALFLKSEGLDWPERGLTGEFLKAARKAFKAAKTGKHQEG